MGRLSVPLLLMVLVLAPLMPLAASADRGSELGGPTPTPTPPPATAQGLEDGPDPETLEDFRNALLDLRDILEELRPYAQYGAQLKGEQLRPLPSRELIQTLTHEELKMIYETFGDEYEPFRRNIAALKSLVLTPEKQSGEAKGQPSPDSFTIIPTPVPVTTPPPGITHQNHEGINTATGDLIAPDYPTSVGCAIERPSNPLMLGLLIAKAAGDLANRIAEAQLCEGSLVLVPIPFGCVGSNLVGCLAWAVIHELALTAQATFDGFSFCITAIDAAELEAARRNLRIIHADLAEHDEGLIDRFNTTDQFLFQFRDLNLRSRIEANLASPVDDPIALFTLPGNVCITSDLEVFDANDPADRFRSARIAGCGLLEVVSDTVRSAIDMTAVANGSASVNSAEAEFQAAVDHYNNQQWKLAYDRFRKAYREAMKP